MVDNICCFIDGAELEGAISPIIILLEKTNDRLEVVERYVGIRFPIDDANGKDEKLSK